ncbi:MAG: metallophosphoesterase [Erysipelothrix sp.]|nr:metallophosphoesterase [Erysipelothrix sp.]
MKIVVCGDNHGLISPLEEILNKHPDADAYIHCGDSELPPEYLERFHAVTGNNDYFYKYPEYLIVDVKGIKIYVTHGHQYYGDRVDGLSSTAVNHHCDIACYGHTHVFDERYAKGVLCLNPGSLRYNRDGTNPSYAVIEKVGDRFEITRFELD